MFIVLLSRWSHYNHDVPVRKYGSNPGPEVSNPERGKPGLPVVLMWVWEMWWLPHIAVMKYRKMEKTWNNHWGKQPDLIKSPTKKRDISLGKPWMGICRIPRFQKQSINDCQVSSFFLWLNTLVILPTTPEMLDTTKETRICFTNKGAKFISIIGYRMGPPRFLRGLINGLIR